ncbi:DNA polymerase I [Pantanalinema rosaneae CENA516]|uniref:DNA polymerase I n=1 Tax=Pantanalinema rosaneae TaxID=1620701 RepID=UPI003D6EE782
MAADPSSTKPMLILVDGHSLAFRAYFAFAKGRDGGLRTKSGIPTSVAYGFLKALLEVMETEQPQYVAIAFDMGEKTFRHEADTTYKAGRPDVPEDFLPNLANLQELLAVLNLPVLTAPGYEADDIIGTLARRASQNGFQVRILSGDRDLFQLIDPDETVKVLYLSSTFGKGTPPPKEFGVEEVKAKMGVLPSQVVDFKALCGDSSDNIPGVRGIGEKTATQLLNTYGSLEQVYAAIEQIKGATRKKLEEGRDNALHSQYLAQIHLDVPLDIELENCRLKGFDQDVVLPFLEKLEFRSFIKRFQKLQQQFGGSSVEAIAEVETTLDALPERPQIEGLTIAQEDDDLWFFSPEETELARSKPKIVLTPQIIDTPEKLQTLVQSLQTRNHPETPVAWDTETTSLEPRDAGLVGIGCCWGNQPNQVAYIPIGHTNGANLNRDLVLEALRPILEHPNYPKVLQNAKYDRLVLQFQGIQLDGVVFDTLLASYVINPEESHNLSDLGRKHLGIIAKSYEQLVPKGKTIADIEIPAVADYCGMDAYTTFQLMPILMAELEQTPALKQLLLNVEQPLEPVLAAMEALGVRIDCAYLKELSQHLEQELAEIEQRAYEIAGATFNLSSPKQLSQLLFETLGLDRKKSRKTTLGYSTDAVVLEKLQGDHPVIDVIVDHRTLAKLKSTYVDALPNLMRQDTERVHTNFNQTITATGRLSSSNPNLQNIPIRTAFSRQIRKAFIPEPGWVIVAADYSQIELRILAHLSQEPVLIEAYQNRQDVHTLTAQLLFEKEAVTVEERRLGKIINFGVIYGMGASRFAREANVARKQAQTFIDRFNERYSRVFRYLKQMQQEAIAQGYVETILGRRRYFNFAGSELKKLRGMPPQELNLDSIKTRDKNDAQLLRAAANAPIQGSSADIIKVAMVKLQQQLAGYNARMLLQVHDELILEMPLEEWDTLKSTIQSTMESAVKLSIPLMVEIHAGSNWMEAK